VCLVAEGGDSVCMLLHGDVVQQLRDIMVKLTASWSWSKYVPRCNRLHTYVVETCTPHSLPTWLPPLLPRAPPTTDELMALGWAPCLPAFSINRRAI
jgi:hypothetical protein